MKTRKKNPVEIIPGTSSPVTSTFTSQRRKELFERCIICFSVVFFSLLLLSPFLLLNVVLSVCKLNTFIRFPEEFPLPFSFILYVKQFEPFWCKRNVVTFTFLTLLFFCFLSCFFFILLLLPSRNRFFCQWWEGLKTSKI